MSNAQQPVSSEVAKILRTDLLTHFVRQAISAACHVRTLNCGVCDRVVTQEESNDMRYTGWR